MVQGGMRPDLVARAGEDGLQRDLVLKVEQGKNEIMSKATTGDWEEVLKILRQGGDSSCLFCLLSMNYSKDTVVHLAASEGQTDVVVRVLKLLSEDNDLVNESGNTPLHLAVANRHVDTCRKIVEIAPHLALARNVEGETPIYVAALNGFTQIFSTLHSKSSDTALIRRNDGDTILHCAIAGEYFGCFSLPPPPPPPP